MPNSRALIVYLDSQDYSRFGDVLRGKGDAAAANIFSKLKDQKAEGLAIFGVSMPLMSELLQFHPDHRETSLCKAEAIESLCGPYAFPTPMKLAAMELASAAFARGLITSAPKIEMPLSDRGWFPGFGSTIVDFRELVQAATLRSLENLLPDPAMLECAKQILAETNWCEQIEAHVPALADHFQLPQQTIKNALVPLFAGEITPDEASQRMFSGISEPVALLELGQRLGLPGVGIEQLAGEIPEHLCLFDPLGLVHFPQGFHRGVMRGRHLHRERTLHGVFRLGATHECKSGRHAVCRVVSGEIAAELAEPVVRISVGVAAPRLHQTQLTGDWRGHGNVFTFGAPVEVDHRYVLKGDGTFETVQRYRGQDGAWKEQRVVGQWIARRGSAAGLCDVTMKMRGEWGEASSNSTYRLTAPGRFRFEDADFDMVRASP